jgi:hypothetical protein
MEMKETKKQNYFLILFDVYTVIIWLLLLVEFLGRGVFETPAVLISLYLIVLTYYASDKEIRRWRLKQKFGRRRGEIFVFLWVITLIAVVAYYILGGEEKGYNISGSLLTVAGAVAIIYMITDYLKEEFSRRK